MTVVEGPLIHLGERPVSRGGPNDDETRTAPVQPATSDGVRLYKIRSGGQIPSSCVERRLCADVRMAARRPRAAPGGVRGLVRCLRVLQGRGKASVREDRGRGQSRGRLRDCRGEPMVPGMHVRRSERLSIRVRLRCAGVQRPLVYNDTGWKHAELPVTGGWLRGRLRHERERGRMGRLLYRNHGWRR